ncbi:MAG: YcaO-like family protein [Thiotrichales bacterium]|nr:YcaO-like family protein [Thiotrichales bacterium]
MVEQTYIKGKDACLEDSILKMHRLLEEAGFEIEEASWLNPVPNVYSLHIRDKNCPALFTNGKGASRKACLASALGEFFERLETNYFFSDFFLGGQADRAHDWLYFPNEKAIEPKRFKEVLTPSLWQFYDPYGEMAATDFLSLNDDVNAIRCLPMRQVSTGDIVYFPMNLFSNLYASNGLCAGNTHVEAQVQGLSEVFERWVKRKILVDNLCIPEVPEHVVLKYPQVVEARKKLVEQGVEVSIRDASLGGKYPVMNVTLFDQSSGQCFASFGAHPIFEVALERTLTESLQGRSLSNLDGFQTPIFDEQLVADDENIENHFIDSSGLIHAKFISDQYDYEFCEWDFSGTTQEQFDFLVKAIHQEGSDVYVTEYEHFGVPASRIVVPGMSEVFPLQELVDNNQNRGRALREILNNLAANLSMQQFEKTLDALSELGFSDHQGVANLIGLLPDGDSYWKKFKIVELEMWCLLAVKDYEQAHERLQDCFYFVDDEAMMMLYKALSFALEIVLSDEMEFYSFEMQKKLFGTELVDRVWRYIEGEAYLADLPIGNKAFELSKSHQTLLNVYCRIQEFKQKAF